MKGLELRYSKDCDLVKENLYRLRSPVNGFTYLKVDKIDNEASIGFIVDDGSFCSFMVGQIVFSNHAVLRIVIE